MQKIPYSSLEWRRLSPRWRLTTLCLALMSLNLLLPNILPRSLASTDSLWLPNLKGHVQGIKDSVQRVLHGEHDSFRKTEEFPNIVDFVHLLKLDTNQTFDFPFRQLIAICSARHYLQAEILYIHTNIPEH